MASLVVREWQVGTTPIDQEGNFVGIRGRKSGWLAWLLSVAGIEPGTSLRIDRDRVQIDSATFSDTTTSIVPVEHVTSTFYGFHRPFAQACAIFIVVSYIAATMLFQMKFSLFAFVMFVFAETLGAVIAITVFMINKSLTFGIVEASGRVYSLRFKPSVIENTSVDISQVQRVCEVFQKIVEAKGKKPMAVATPVATATPTVRPTRVERQ